MYPRGAYAPESDQTSAHYSYFNSPDTIFPVWNRSTLLKAKEVVLGLGDGDAYKAYPVETLQREMIVNDEIGNTKVVIIASSISQAARVYERDGHVLSIDERDNLVGELPTTLVDSDGATWQITEDFLVRFDDPSETLSRVATHMSFWFSWYSFHPGTEIYSSDGD